MSVAVENADHERYSELNAELHSMIREVADHDARLDVGRYVTGGKDGSEDLGVARH